MVNFAGAMTKAKIQKRKNTALISKVNLNIKKRREKLDIPQMELDAKTGLKMYKYESGEKDMTLTTLGIIADALKTEPHILLR